MSSIKYKLVYDVVRNWQLFEVLLLCLRNSIDGCVSKTEHLKKSVMLKTRKARVDQRAHGTRLPFQFTYSSQYLQVLQLRARRTLVSYTSNSPTSLPFRLGSLNDSLPMHSVHFSPNLELKGTLLIAFFWST